MSWSSSGAARFGRVVVLDADPELAERLDGDRLVQARRLSVTRALQRRAGVWDAREDAPLAHDGLGLLVLEGLLVRRVGMAGRHGAELLGAGDVLQPAQDDGGAATLVFAATWRVLAPLRLAVLDLAWMGRLAPYPEVMAALATRIMLRSRRLAALLAIVQHPRLEDRLRLLFWELADRHGRVTRDGVRLDLPLTHELLADLIGASRPSVSTALGRLERGGHLRRTEGGWLVLSAPPPTAGDPVAPEDAS
jgi:hypothetical protein